MPNYDETAVIAALTRTMVMQNAQEAADEREDLSEHVIVLQEDLVALRGVALARRDNDGQLQVSHALNVLNSKYAEYGRGQGSIRISRNEYDRMLAPQRLFGRLDRETL